MPQRAAAIFPNSESKIGEHNAYIVGLCWSVLRGEKKITTIVCPKCGNNREFAVVVASVFNVYVDGDGKTLHQDPLIGAGTGVDRVECTCCHAELYDVGYDLKTEEAYLYKERYAKAKMVHAA